MGIIGKQGIRNAIITYIGVFIGFINVIVLQPIMLKPDELGLIRMLYSVSILLATIFPLGINGITTRFFPQFRNNKNGHNGYLSIICFIALILYLLFSILVFIFKNVIFEKYQNSELFLNYFYYIFPLTFFLGFLSIINFYAFSLFKTIIPVFLNEIFNRILITIVISLYFINIISINIFVLFFVFVYALQLLILIIYIYKTDKLLINWNISFFKKLNLISMLKYGILMSFTILASMALRNIDILLIGSNLLNSETPLNSVAIYTIAYTIGSLIETPATSLTKIADPQISEAFNTNDVNKIKSIYYKSTQILMLIGGFLLINLLVNVDSILSYLPVKYHEGNYVVIFIALSAFFNMATGINGSIIYYSKYYLYGSILLFVLVLLSLVLNILLIPKFGINGAAMASFLSLIIFNLFKFILIYKNFKFQPYNINSIKILILILVSFFIAFNISIPVNNILLIIIKFIVVSLIFILGILKLKLVNIIYDYFPNFKINMIDKFIK